MNQRTDLDEWLEHSPRIVGSTLLIHRLKTKNFALILGAYETRAASLVSRLDGRLIDSVGDELFAAFRTATGAYQFASELFRDPGHPELSVRAGVHFGSVQVLDARLVGRSVHLGARVMMHGRDHELWISDAEKAAIEMESATFASTIAWLGSVECELKGFPDTQRLWRAA